MKMKRRMYQVIRRTILPVAGLMLVLAGLLSGLGDTYHILLAEATVEKGDTAEQVTLVFTGTNMLRINAFYLDGKQVKDSRVSRITYSQGSAMFDRALLQDGEWYKLEVGFSKWGIINLKSNPIWIEWTEELVV